MTLTREEMGKLIDEDKLFDTVGEKLDELATLFFYTRADRVFNNVKIEGQTLKVTLTLEASDEGME